MCKTLKYLVSVIGAIVISFSISASADKDVKKSQTSIKAVPVEKVLKKKYGKVIVLKDKIGRRIIVDNGVFKLPTETVDEILARGKKKKGGGDGGGMAPYPPKPSNCTQVGGCTETNWTRSCGNGGTQECKQFSCFCAAQGGGSYKKGMASCGSCRGGGSAGGVIGNIPETQTPGY